MQLYEKLLKEYNEILEKMEDEDARYSLREDWEIGRPQEDGRIEFIYTAGCMRCSYSIKIKTFLQGV